MNIKEHFPGKVLAAYEDSAIVTDKPAGPNKMEISLAEFVERMTGAESSGAEALHARPNPLANMTGFVELIRRINRSISTGHDSGMSRKEVLNKINSTDRARYFEWLGLSAIVALRGIYSLSGLDIHMEKVALHRDKPLDFTLMFALNNMNESYQFLVDSYNSEDQQPLEGGFYYLKQGEQYFAIYSHDIGICPMQNYSSSLFQGLVPWYKWEEGRSEHDSWIDPIECLEKNAYALNRFRAWLCQNGYNQHVYGGKEQTFNYLYVSGGWENEETQLNESYKNYLSRNEKVLENNPSIKKSMTGKAAKFCQVCCAYADEDHKGHFLPRIFTEEMMLAQRKTNECCGLGYDAVEKDSFSWKELKWESSESVESNLPDLERYIPLVPFTKEAADLCGKAFEISDLKFEPESKVSGKLEGVTVTVLLKIKNSQEEFRITRYYSIEKIRGGVLPYLMVWPWVELPKDSWNTYFATQKASSADFEGRYGIRLGGVLVLDFPDDRKYESREIRECGAGGKSWVVYQSHERYQYAVIKRYMDAGHPISCGVVLIPRINERKADHQIAYDLAIDFGTTSTVCAIRASGEKEKFLPYLDYSRNVTIGDLEKDIYEVAQERWLGRGSGRTQDVLSERKTLTVAQLYARELAARTLNAGEDELFMTGRFFLATSSMLCQYASGDSFAGRGIYNDLKLSENTRLEERRASTVFLAGIYMEALLYVISREEAYNGKIQEFKVSFPGGLTKDSLIDLWQGAAKLVNNCLAPESEYRLDPGKIKYYTEARAVQVYNRDRVVDVSSYVNIDIGGGTTDVSVTNIKDTKENATLSFKYAGRELMIDSFIEAYRHWKGGRSEDRFNHLAKMWGESFEKLPPQTKKQLLEHFFEQCDKCDKNQTELEKAIENEALRMFTEILLNDFVMKIPNESGYNFFRSIVTAKFFALMRMVAEFIKENKTMLLKGCPTFCVQGGKEGKVISLVFTGTASRTLQHIFNRDLNEINSLSSEKASDSRAKMLGALAQMIAETAEIEGNVALKLIISSDVQEKKEVAFGMMKETISPEASEEDKEWTAEELLEMAGKLSDEELRDFYFESADEYLPAENPEQKVLEFFKKESSKGRAFAENLQERINNEKVKVLVENAEENTEELQSQIEHLINYWGKITESKNTWPTSPAVGSDYGFGDKIRRLSDVIPKGNTMKGMINQCILNISADRNKCRYLVSLKDDRYREIMFMVYITDMIINKSLAEKQS